MGLIEQAAQRLEALRKAGIDAPVRTNSTIEAAADALREPTLREPRVPVAEALSAPITGPAPFEAPDVDPRRGHRVEPKLPHPAAQEPTGDGRRSRLVELDLEALAAAGYLTPEGKRTQLADEFRVVKRPIIKNAQGRGAGQIERGNRVMVTSALPGEGKTFCALNLAISIATEVDSTVLLVDADVANPSVMKALRLPKTKGLLDLLSGDSTDVADVLVRTNIDKLSILPAGTAHPRATEMLASTSMADLVDQMAMRYPDRILVFDSPPLLATTEARVLASLMGQIVMVVEADRTAQAAVARALETIESCPVVMVMLNKTSRSEVGGYYGYGAYGAYGATP